MATAIARKRPAIHVALSPMTDPMGRNWKQPSASGILIDEKHALMSSQDFDKLAEYSASNPTGCYLGKMWKRHDGKYADLYAGRRPIELPPNCRWLLCWFDVSDRGPDFCSTQFREILLVDGEL